MDEVGLGRAFPKSMAFGGDFQTLPAIDEEISRANARKLKTSQVETRKG
jgi:hypothetical protein